STPWPGKEGSLMKQEQRWMQMALEEARKGRGDTFPNPMVGALIIRDGEIVARGYHRAAGQPHAEIEALHALAAQGLSARGCTMVVTLEPCSHYGRTPPCSQRLCEEQVKRVVVGTIDTAAHVDGRGIRQMRDAGIQVDVGILEEKCRALNAPFFTRMREQRVYVQLKAACSLDARIATHTGDSKWLSGELARVWAHEQRAYADAILVGVGTVLADNPKLTVRHTQGSDPHRYVLDTHLRTPLDAAMVQPEHVAKTSIFTAQIEEAYRAPFLERGVELISVGKDRVGHVDLGEVLEHLYRRNHLHLLVEGGGQIHGTFLKQSYVDRLSIVLTPWLLGQNAIPAFGFDGPSMLQDALQLEGAQIRALGQDWLFEAQLKHHCCG
ncbi:MAG: bifunctional diaminohydroxyphosphoribosylaminopyrimidine deaminase/5-amino-6-(5-phosphoribosylamino)uracil reductase RibD, partial [Myxococcota bacterium]